MLMIYVAHKFGADLSNAIDAEKWTAWLNEQIEGAIFICPWLPMVRHWVDSGESRARGLMLDLECVKKCDALIALSPLVGGVRAEWDWAKNKIHFDSEREAALGDASSESHMSRVIQCWVNGLGAF